MKKILVMTMMFICGMTSMMAQKPAEIKLAESLVEENKEMIIERWKAFFEKQ